MPAEVPVRPDAHGEWSSNPPQGGGTDGELILAGVIDNYDGPIVEREDRYKGRGDEHGQVMAQAQVYRLLTDRSFHELELHLRHCPRVRYHLGLDRALDHTTFSRSWNEQFSGGVREYLNEYCSWIQEELETLDLPEVEPYLPAASRSYEIRETLTDAQKRRCTRNVWGIIYEEFDFDRGPGIEWSTQYLYGVFAEGASSGITPYEVLDKQRKESEDASLKTVMNATDQRSADEWIDLFDRLFQRLFDRMQALG